MQAIILAAGMGKRLGEYTKNNTKCMVPVNGIPLIDRLLGQLSIQNLNRIVIVVGYEGERLVQYINQKWKELNITFINNDIYYKTNNIFSLSLARKEMEEDDTLLIESDLIFEDGMFDLLLNDPFPNLALVAKYETWMDGTMVKIDNENNIVNFVPKADFSYSETGKYYKTVNIYKFSKEFSKNKYIPFLDAYMKVVGDNEYYENVLRVLAFLNRGELKAHTITNEKWYEIDDKQDLDIAEALFADEEHLLKKYYGRYGGFWRFPGMLDFCYLVNPYFQRSRIIDEIEANFRTLISEYPSGMKVNTLLASKCWGVKEDFIIPGNGAAELIKILMENINGKFGVIRPTFEEYPNRIEEDRVVEFIPNKPDFRYNVDDLVLFFGNKEIDTLLLINPDNPSGNFIPSEEILKLLNWCKQKSIKLILDESFVDFSDNWENSSFLRDDLLIEYPNLIVVKSISKSYGVPGIRLGILASSDMNLISEMKKQVSIWNLNSFAEFFMQIYTKYEKDYKHACEQFIKTRQDFLSGLNEIPFLHVMPTQANFVFCEVKTPYTAIGIVVKLLKDYNILVSACSAKKGIESNKYIRVAIRNHKDNERIINALKQF